MLVPGAANRRFMLVADTIAFIKLGEWLHEKWGNKYNVTHNHLPYWLLALASLWDA